jgi:hypothetical protein
MLLGVQPEYPANQDGVCDEMERARKLVLQATAGAFDALHN